MVPNLGRETRSQRRPNGMPVEDEARGNRADSRATARRVARSQHLHVGRPLHARR